MKRIYHHFEKWEDWKHGFFSTCSPNLEFDLADNAYALLSNCDLLRNAMLSVIEKWPRAAEVNLSHNSGNRQAWLGQGACCLTDGVPADVTKLAWHRLTEQQQNEANGVADEIIALWEKEHAEA